MGIVNNRLAILFILFLGPVQSALSGYIIKDLDPSRKGLNTLPLAQIWQRRNFAALDFALLNGKIDHSILQPTSAQTSYDYNISSFDAYGMTQIQNVSVQLEASNSMVKADQIAATTKQSDKNISTLVGVAFNQQFGLGLSFNYMMEGIEYSHINEISKTNSLNIFLGGVYRANNNLYSGLGYQIEKKNTIVSGASDLADNYDLSASTGSLFLSIGHHEPFNKKSQRGYAIELYLQKRSAAQDKSDSNSEELSDLTKISLHGSYRIPRVFIDLEVFYQDEVDFNEIVDTTTKNFHLSSEFIIVPHWYIAPQFQYQFESEQYRTIDDLNEKTTLNYGVEAGHRKKIFDISLAVLLESLVIDNTLLGVPFRTTEYSGPSLRVSGAYFF